MTLSADAVAETLALAEKHALLTAAETREVMAAFDPSWAFAPTLAVADSLHVHAKVDDTGALPRDAFVAAGAEVESEKPGYVKFAFPSGLNLIFSSMDVSQDDLREKATTSRRQRPFLDHFGVDMRRETSDVRAVFERIPSQAAGLGWGTVSQGGDRKVYCCHVTVSAKHWVFPRTATGARPPSIEFALGPLSVDLDKSGCDLRPADPADGPAQTCSAEKSCGG